MTKRRTYLAGWGIAASAILCTVMAVPSISSSAKTLQQAERLQDRAAAFEQIQDSYEVSGDVSDFAMTLTESYLDSANTAAVVTPFDSEAQALITEARQAAAERQCLAEAVYYEARSESRSGQKAVAEVILNRVDSKHFPDSICGVVYQGSERTTGCQFSFTCDGSMDRTPKGKAWDRSVDVADLMLTGGVAPFTDRATHYHTTAVNPHWSGNLRMTKRVGSHVFYRFAPRDYTPSTPSLLTAPPT